MWKPGAARPQHQENKFAALASVPAASSISPLSSSRTRKRDEPLRKNTNDNNNQDGQGDTQMTDAHDEHGGGGSDGLAKVFSTSPFKKQLSGATLNMRFMQRKKQIQQQQNSTPSSKSSSQAEKIKQNSAGRRNSKGDSRQQQQQQQTKSGGDIAEEEEEDDDMVMPGIVATPAEMYGVFQSNLLGRRSFNGFHRHVQESWNLSYQLRKEELRNDRKQKSDAELLEQYKTFVGGPTTDNSGSSKKNNRKRKSR